MLMSLNADEADGRLLDGCLILLPGHGFGRSGIVPLRA